MFRHLTPTSIAALAQLFASPPREGRPWVRWCWDVLNPSVLENELLRFHREEGGPVVIVTVAGAGAAFGTSEWLHAFQRITSLAARLDQPLWIQLPDFHSPHLTPVLVGDRERYRARVLTAEYWETRPGKWRKRRFETPVVLAVAAPLQRQHHLSLSQSLDVTRALNRFEMPRGLSASVAYRVLAFCVQSVRDADCLVSECVETYVRSVLEPLLQAAREHFGVSVQGVVAPAPPVLAPQASPTAFPWPGGLAKQFMSRHGYPLLPQLPALTTDTGVAAPRIRRNFWETVAARYRSHALEPIRDWCHANGVAVSFSFPEKTDFVDQLRHCVDPLAVADLSDVFFVGPGPDLRLRARIALHPRDAHPGRETLLVATHPPAGDCVSVRRAALATAARLGLTSSLTSPPPPPQRLETSDTVAALHEWQGRGHLLSRAGRRACQVGLVFPLRSLWSHFHPQGHDPLFRVVETDLRYLTDLLVQLGHEFDLLDEEALVHAHIENERLCVGERTYQMIVLPSVTWLPRAVWDLCVGFSRQGGRVAVLGVPPRESEVGVDTEFADKVQSDTLIDVAAVYAAYEKAARGEPAPLDSFPIFREDPSEGRLCCFQPRLGEDQDDARLRVMQIMVESLDPEVAGSGDTVSYEHRRLDDANLYVIANQTNEPVRARIRVRRTGIPSRWKVDDAEYRELPDYAVIDGLVSAFSFNLAPRETAAITIRPGAHDHVDGANFTVTGLTESVGGVLTAAGYSLQNGKVRALFEPRAGQPEWVEEVVDQPLCEFPVEQWRLTATQRNRCLLSAWQVRDGRHVPRLGARLLGTWNRDWNPVAPLGQLRPGATWRTEFRIRESPVELHLAAPPTLSDWEMFLNGRHLGLQDAGLSEAGWVETDLAGRLRMGGNELVLVSPPTADPGCCPSADSALWLVGRFHVTPESGGPMLTPAPEGVTLHLSDLLSGRPDYRGELVVTASVDLPENSASGCLFLVLDECRFPVEAQVNGVPAGRCWVAPHRFDLTSHIQVGHNEITLRFLITASCEGPPVKSATLLLLPAVYLTYRPSAQSPKEQERPSLQVIHPQTATGAEWN